MSTTQEKDVLFGTKSTNIGQSKAKSLTDGVRLTLSLNQETAKSLYETLGNYLDNEPGVKIDIHYGTKTTDTRSFSSAFFFVKKIGERPATAPKTFVKASVKQEMKRLGN